MTQHCWDTRGNDTEMCERCPNNTPHHPCPFDCWNAECKRPMHKQVDILDTLAYPDVDRSAPIKEICLTCEFFLTHGPKIPDDPAKRRKPMMSEHSIREDM